jgi:elongation factor 1 alpha-like protein
MTALLTDERNPGFLRVLTKGSSAEIQITLRGNGGAGASSAVRSIPLEPFSLNKEMGRVLIRRGGETIAAGKDFQHSFPVQVF